MFNLYENIKMLCNESGLSVSAMCEKAGISKSIMSNLNNGRSDSISAKTAAKIAAVLGVPVDDVLHGRETKKAPVQPDKRYSSDDINLMRMALESAMMQKFNRLDDEDQQDIICQVLLKLQNQKYQDDQQ